MRTFGDTVRLLMERRGLTGAALSREIDVSKTSISKLLQGHSKPKQVTFSRLVKALCTSPEEEQMMLKSFTGQACDLPELVVEDTEANEREELARAERYLEMKTQAIGFRRSVARELDKAGIPYQQDYCEGIYSTDFLVEVGGRRIALECKSNAGRHSEKPLAACKIIVAELDCASVLIVMPSLPDRIGLDMPKLVNFITAQDLAKKLLEF